MQCQEFVRRQQTLCRHDSKQAFFCIVDPLGIYRIYHVVGQHVHPVVAYAEDYEWQQCHDHATCSAGSEKQSCYQCAKQEMLRACAYEQGCHRQPYGRGKHQRYPFFPLGQCHFFSFFCISRLECPRRANAVRLANTAIMPIATVNMHTASKLLSGARL